MPIYEYNCKACGHEFEVMQKITENPIRKCEKCGKARAKRMISQTSFILKGSGWYATDYSGKNPSNNENGSSDNRDKSSDSKDKSSDSKDNPAESPTPNSKKTPQKVINA